MWIPLFGWQLNPMFGAAAMSLSSFCVVTNALRLNFVDIRSTKHDHKKKHTAAPAQEQSCPDDSCTIKEDTTMSKTISIEGMMCQHCVAHVTKALTEVPGVESVNVSLENKNAVVTGSADDKALTAAVKEAGYKVKKIV